METGLKPPQRLDVTSCNLSQTWRHWKEEFTLYVDLTVGPTDDKRKVKLFYYLIGENGRELAHTLLPDTDNLLLADIVQAFDKHCDPKKNETVERYKFFTRHQEDGENVDRYLTELRRLAETCGFGEIRDSLIKDRMVCGIRDSHLKERLLREEGMTLEKCMQICRAAELTQHSLKMMAGTSENDDDKVHAVSMKGKTGPDYPINTVHCKYCGKRHERDKTKCPAYGETCRSCGKKNHYSAVCRQGRGKQYRQLHTVTPDTDSAEDITWLQMQSTTEKVNVVGQAVVKDAKQLYATFLLDEKPIRFQLDCGASCNVISFDLLNKQVSIEPTDKVLVMYNKSVLKPMGTCKLKIRNPCNRKSYRVEFTVLRGGNHVPLLGVKAVQAMDLIKVQSQNIMSVEVAQDIQNPKLNAEHNLDMQKIKAEYADVFEGDGCFEGKYRLEIDNTVQPTRLPTRRVPVALMQPLKVELQDLQRRGMIAPVHKSTDWISSLVIVQKPSGKLRICIDPKPLNKALKRNHYPMPTLDDVLPDLSKAKIFSVCDVKNGFWHVALTEDSSLLTTFSSPFGRFKWLKMPMGLKPAPEIFQQKLMQALEGLTGVKTIADDILVVGEGENMESAIKDHDQKMIQFLDRCREKNIKLNLDKFKLKMTEVAYIGHRLTSTGVRVDPEKVRAIQDLPTPTDVSGVQRFLGMVNYLSKFCRHLSDMCEPLRQLTHKDVRWEWTESQETAFRAVKNAIADTATLKYFDPDREVVVQCDASEKGLGATLMQNKQPITFASRALTTTEQGYAQIEKELLAVVFGMEKFHQYTYGRRVTVQSDHKPLESITKKPLLNAPKRLQRMLLRLQKYDVDIGYCPGRDLLIADTLSRAYLPSTKDEEEDIETINMCNYLAVSKEKVKQIQIFTEKDKSLQSLKTVILQGWPKYKQHAPREVSPFFHIRDELSVQQGIIFKGDRAVIPEVLRRDILKTLHSSHLGMEGCLRRARESVYWPGMNDHIKNYIAQCEICASCNDKQPKETLQPHEIPHRPWSKIGTDLFTWNDKEYLITVDYFSNFWEVDLVQDTRARTVIKKLKAHFARYGIPDIVFSDNAAQFTSEEFKTFSKKWEFEHQTSSPRYPQSNGKAESAVKTAKRLMQKANQAGADVYLSILDHRNTPTQGLDSSPAQRLMSRRTKTLVPTACHLLEPKLLGNIEAKLQKNQARQAFYYNKSAKDLPELQRNDNIRLQPSSTFDKHWQKAKVVQKLGPRSYEILTDDGRRLRRNRRYLRKTQERDDSWPFEQYPDTQDNEAASTSQAPTVTADHQGEDSGQRQTISEELPDVPDVERDTSYITRAGRISKKPAHLKDYI